MENNNTEDNSYIDSVKGAIDKYKKRKKVGWLFKLNILLIPFAILIIIMAIGMATDSGSSSSNGSLSGSGGVTNVNLSPSTLQWEKAVKDEAKKQGVSDLVPYILAIIEVESKGEGIDIMHSSASAGLSPDDFKDPKDSIKQGISYLKGGWIIAGKLGLKDQWGVIQGYNFGMDYLSYLANNNLDHSTKIADEYSLKVVAPSLGNETGETYEYKNSISMTYNGGYLYSNGGNFFYVDLVRQYLKGAGSAELPIGDDVFNTIMQEAIKYEGNPYVWGGYSPTTGFDCSGLMQWVFSKAGIAIPRTAAEQWKATEEIPLEEARPGDLIFFKGTYGAPDHISHVGIYIDENRMFDANNSGVGYHYWTSTYWTSHFASIHRVIQ